MGALVLLLALPVILLFAALAIGTGLGAVEAKTWLTYGAIASVLLLWYGVARSVQKWRGKL